MIYYLVLLLLLVGTVLEYKKRKTIKYMYILVMFIFTFLLCFRFGQGTDYLGYYSQYKFIPTTFNTFMQTYKDYHGEFGWLLLVFSSNKVGLSFEMFNFLLSFIMMLSLNNALKNFSPLKICSCLLFFPTYYMTYCFSGIRQGLCLCLFLGLGLKLLFNKKYLKYFLLIIFMSMMHKSVCLLLIIPFVMDINLEKYEKYLLLIPFLSFVFFYLGFFDIICKSMFGMNGYLNFNISILAIVVRLIYYMVIKLLHYKVKRYNNDIENKLYNVYMLNFYIFLGLSFTATLSQRLTMPMKALEIILIPIQLSLMYNNLGKKQIKKTLKEIIFDDRKVTVICSLLIMLIPCVEVYKNINAYLKQGKYYEKYNSFEYPYISVFTKEKMCDYIEETNCNMGD